MGAGVGPHVATVASGKGMRHPHALQMTELKKNGAGDVGGYISDAASRTTATKGGKSAVVHATNRY